jgi:hypothetical protein
MVGRRGSKNTLGVKKGRRRGHLRLFEWLMVDGRCFNVDEGIFVFFGTKNALAQHVRRISLS